MKVEAVQSNDRRQTCLIPMAKGMLYGAAGGFAAKYLLPIQPDEMQTPEYQKVVGAIDSQRTEYNAKTKQYLDTLRFKENKTLAQDQFVKMFDGLKEGDRVKRSSIRNALKTLEEKAPLQVDEFKRLCKDSSEVARKTAQQTIKAFNFAVKRIRPTGYFMSTGAVVGAIIALIDDVCRANK
ncbi:MAG: hypothetical protein ACI37Q_05025 [Candidatus Gastranaerophilaceae bacterium]